MAMSTSAPAEKSDLERAVAKAHPWIEMFARMGYVAKGIVYALIGIFAFLASMNMGGGAKSPKGILNFLGDMPLGRLLLFPIGVGLFGYCLWRILAAIFNPENKKPYKRIGYVATAIAYGTLAYASIKLALFAQKASVDDKRWTLEFLNRPGGKWLLIGVGIAIVAIGLVQFWNAFTCNFCDVLKKQSLSEKTLEVARWTGRIGLCARGMLFFLIGYFAIRTGLTANWHEAGGVDEALMAMKTSSAGLWLMGAVALGLLCYAAFMFIEARYRKIQAADKQLVREEKLAAAN